MTLTAAWRGPRPKVLRAVVSDIVKSFNVDPCADGLLQPALFFKVPPAHPVAIHPRVGATAQLAPQMKRNNVHVPRKRF